MTNSQMYTKEQLRKKKRIEYRRKVKKFSKITYLILLVSAIILFLIIKGFNVLPLWALIVMGMLFLLILIPLGYLALVPAIKNSAKKIQSSLCIVFSLLMLFGCIKLPAYKGSLEKVFVRVPDIGELNIGVYTLKSANISSLEELAGKKVGIQTKLDGDYQTFAIKVVNKEIEGEDIQVVEENGIYKAVEALYAGEVSAILLNESYADIIKDNENYKDFEEKTTKLYTCAQKVDLKVNTATVSNITKEPFVVAVTGVDEWNTSYLSPTANPKSDVNMIVVVNPLIKQILLISIPRDSYLGLIRDGSVIGYDKLTHATTVRNGMDVWINTLNKLLDTQIHYYLRVNYMSLRDVVDALDGIDVYNAGPAFTTNAVDRVDDNGNIMTNEIGWKFKEGYNHVNGEEALGYCRERYSLENGDMDRNRHQVEVMKACIKKVCSPSIITKIDSLLKAVEGKFTTNLEMNDIYALAQMQLNDMADWDIAQYGMIGETGWGESYVSEDEVSIVELYDSSIEKARKYIKQALAGEKVVIE